MSTPYRRVIEVIEDHTEVEFHPKFLGWLIANFDIWREFEDRAVALIADGRPKFSARALVDYMRWDTNEDFGETGRHWSVPNEVTPDFGRLWGLLHPRHADFFENRDRFSLR